MPDLPTGTVTLLFTDIEGSTRLVQQLADDYRDLLATHRELLRNAFAGHGGIEIATEGDALFMAFARATDAVSAAVAGQLAMSTYDWPAQAVMRVRIGLHTGEPTMDGHNYAGYDVHRAARICSSAHGGQVVVSDVTRRLAHEAASGWGFLELGEHRLKDLADPESLFQVVADGLQQQFPPLRSVDAVRTNLPETLTSFVGRDRDLERLERLVGEHRLVTLTGPGGAGKTRLALRAASEVLCDFADGVWLVRLAAVVAHDRVAQTIADTIGLGYQGSLSPLEIIGDYARDKHLLLVLDNFEHLMAAADVVGGLVERCAGLSVLVTSREVLNLRGEQEMSVPPMALPPRGQAEPGRIAQVESVRLFVDRAQSVQPGFAVTRDNAAAVTEIAHRLEGLPLAIELAAARTKMLSPTALVARLSNRLDLLTGGSRDLPERQRTLRATIEWSYGLLVEAERNLLARLSVFAAPVRLETVEAVCGGDDVLEVLAALVDKSLVRRGGEPEDVSFWMLETVREFGRERLLELGEDQHVRRLMIEHYQALATRMGREVLGRRQVGWLDRVENEHDNFQAAIQWSLDTGQPDTAAAISQGIHVFWWIRGRYATGRYWLRRVQAAGLTDPLQRGWLLLANARLAGQQGAFGEAKAGLVEAEATGRRHGDDLLVAHALSELVALQFRYPADEVETATAVADAHAIFRKAGDASAQAELLIRRGGIEVLRGQLTQAVSSMTDALLLMRAVQNPFGQASALNNIGYVGALNGDVDEALPYLEESRQLFESIGSKEGLANVTDTLALVMVGRGDSDQAITLYEQSLELFREMCYHQAMACEQVRLGRLLAETGEYERARASLSDGLLGSEDSGEVEALADAFDAVAALLLRTDRSETAAELFAGARRIRRAERLTLPPVDGRRLERDLALLAHRLDSAALAAASRRGAQRSLDELRSTAREAVAVGAPTPLPRTAVR